MCLVGVFFAELHWTLSLFFPTGNFKGMCKQIDHFPEETDYEADPSEYFLREYLLFFSLFLLLISLMGKSHQVALLRFFHAYSEYFSSSSHFLSRLGASIWSWPACRCCLCLLLARGRPGWAVPSSSSVFTAWLCVTLRAVLQSTVYPVNTAHWFLLSFLLCKQDGDACRTHLPANPKNHNNDSELMMYCWYH